jgi:nucleoid-associated protein YgaU
MRPIADHRIDDADPASPPSLQAIADTARRGRLDEAALLAAQAVAAAPRDPVLAALAGAIEAMRAAATGHSYLETAHAQRPDV